MAGLLEDGLLPIWHEMGWRRGVVVSLKTRLDVVWLLIYSYSWVAIYIVNLTVIHSLLGEFINSF